jgi:TonB-linked SusC/RagA family outer membrane protein
MKNKLFNLLAVLILLLSGTALMGQRQITGKVTDQSGDALIGATVVAKGAATGTATEIDGSFSLTIPADVQALLVSYVGYETLEFALGAENNVTIIMADEAKVLTEVVVTALGIEKEEKKVGYATQDVDGVSLQKAREPNVLSNLTGRVAGLTVFNRTGLFENQAILLRGRSPLIVMDGVPVNTDFWDISSDDIQEITVLKGTAASALYGSLGKDGAIMITTKRARGKGFSVDYNTSNMFQAGWPILPEVQTQYGAGYGGQYAYVDGKGGGIQDGSGWIWGPKLDQPDPNTASGFVEIPQYDSPIDPNTGQRIPTPWVSRGKNNLANFLETGFITSHNLSVSGKNEQGDIRLSVSQFYQNGQEPNTSVNATTFTLAGGYNLGARLKANASLTYNKQYTPNYPRRGYGPQNYIYNLLLWTGPDVDVRDLRNYWIPGQEGLAQRHYNLAWYNNPYFAAFENLQPYSADNTYGYLSLGYTFSPGLQLLVRSGADMRLDQYELLTPKSYILYSDDVNGNYYIENNYDFQLNNDLLLSYNKSFSDNFEVNATLGGTARFRNRRFLSSNTSGLNIPELYTLSNSMNDVTTTNIRGAKRVNSLYATADFGFARAIYLGLTARNDWSSSLPPESNSYFYPSVSLSAVVSELFDMPDFLPFMKLRASWAQVSSDLGSEGSADLGAYEYQATYNPAINWDGVASVLFPGTLANPLIRPETSTTLELGGDIRFINNRLGLDVTYYRTIDQDDIISLPVSLASGFDARLVNANQYRRQGLEVMLNAAPVRSRNFRWDLNLNWASYRRYLDELADGLDELNGVREGERMDIYYGDAFLRAPGGQVIYDANSGLPRIDPNRQSLGFIDPDWVAGLYNQFTIGPVSLSFLIDGRQGGIFYSSTIRKMWWGGTHPDSVTPDRDMENEGIKSYVGEGVVVTGGELITDANGNVISDTREFAPNSTKVFWSNWINSYYHGAAEESNLYDASFIKLREVTVTFQVPKKWIEGIGLSEAAVSFVGRNLALWTDNDYVDPDPYGSPTGGEEYLQTPPSRNIGFNVNVKF